MNARSWQSIVAMLAAMMVVSPWVADAQKKKKKKKKPDPQEQPAPANDAPAGPTPEQQQAAQALFAQGQQAQKDGDYETAVDSYKGAFEVYPDPGLQYLIGEAYRLWGTAESDFSKFPPAVEAYQKFVELVPEGTEGEMGQAREAALQRIEALETALANEDKRKQQEEQAALEAKNKQQEEERKEQEERRKALEARQGTQLSLNAAGILGADQQLSGMLRIIAGGLLNWGRFGVEGHLTGEGFLPIDSGQGVSARAFSLDVGMRFGANDRFSGPYVGIGSSYGFISGSPAQRKLKDDDMTCANFTGTDNSCSFDINRSIGNRLTLGWGFPTSDTTTIGVRADITYWFFSVSDDQPSGSPPAGMVEKPQGALALLIGLEFMRWR